MRQPAEIAGYQLIRELGRGAMGRVFEVEKDGRRLALKQILNPEGKLRQRFLREAQAQARVDSHPHIARVHAFGDSPSGPFLVMELLAGPDLATLLEQRGPLPWDEVKTYLIQICSALESIHKAGLIHRDLKAANIMLRSPGHAVLCDFGVVALSSGSDAERLTQTGASLGTPYAMAPEQLFGDTIDHRADIWALGVLAYEFLSAHKPFSGDDNLAFAHNLAQSRYTPIEQHQPNLPAEARLFIKTSLKAHPAERWASAQQAAEALSAPPVRAVPAGPLLAAALLSILLVTAVLFSQHNPQSALNPASLPWKSLDDKSKKLLIDQLGPLTSAAFRHQPELWSIPEESAPKPSSTVFSKPLTALLSSGPRALLAELQGLPLDQCPPEHPHLALIAFLDNPNRHFSNEKTKNSIYIKLWRELLCQPSPDPATLLQLSALLTDNLRKSPELNEPYLLFRARLHILSQNGQAALQDLQDYLQSLKGSSQTSQEVLDQLETAEQKLWRQLCYKKIHSARELNILLNSNELNQRSVQDWDWLNQQLKASFTPEAEKKYSTIAEAERYLNLIESADQRLALTWPKAPASVLSAVAKILQTRNDTDAQYIVELLQGPNYETARGRNLALGGDFDRSNMDGPRSQANNRDYERRMTLRIRSLLESDITPELGIIRRFGTEFALRQLAPRTADPLQIALYNLMAGGFEFAASPLDHLLLISSLIDSLPALQSAKLTNIEVLTRRQIYFNLRILFLQHSGTLPELCEHLALALQVPFPAQSPGPAKPANPEHSPSCELGSWFEREEARLRELIETAWQPDRLLFDFNRAYFAWTEHCGDPSPGQSRRKHALELMSLGEKKMSHKARFETASQNIAPITDKILAIEAWNYGLLRGKIYEKLGNNDFAIQSCEAAMHKIIESVGLSYYSSAPPEYCEFRELFIGLTRDPTEKEEIKSRFTKLEKDTLSRP